MAGKRPHTNRERAHVPALVSVSGIVQHIVLLRGHKVLLDADLALLYGVETRVLVQAVKRSLDGSPKTSCFS